MSCKNCYEVEVPECPESILLRVALTAATNYYVSIIDKFSERYLQVATSDADGNIDLDLTGIPTGTFNRHAGNFRIEIREGIDDCDPLEYSFCCDGVSKSFGCIIMSFYQSTAGVDFEIGCEC